MVEGAQTLAKFDVYAPVPHCRIHHEICCPLVASWHLGHVGWAALPGQDRSTTWLSTRPWEQHTLCREKATVIVRMISPHGTYLIEATERHISGPPVIHRDKESNWERPEDTEIMIHWRRPLALLCIPCSCSFIHFKYLWWLNLEHFLHLDYRCFVTSAENAFEDEKLLVLVKAIVHKCFITKVIQQEPTFTKGHKI